MSGVLTTSQSETWSAARSGLFDAIDGIKFAYTQISIMRLDVANGQQQRYDELGHSLSQLELASNILRTELGAVAQEIDNLQRPAHAAPAHDVEHKEKL